MTHWFEYDLFIIYLATLFLIPYTYNLLLFNTYQIQ